MAEFSRLAGAVRAEGSLIDRARRCGAERSRVRLHTLNTLAGAAAARAIEATPEVLADYARRVGGAP